jgi:hypothetical protein
MTDKQTARLRAAVKAAEAEPEKFGLQSPNWINRKDGKILMDLAAFLCCKVGNAEPTGWQNNGEGGESTGFVTVPEDAIKAFGFKHPTVPVLHYACHLLGLSLAQGSDLFILGDWPKPYFDRWHKMAPMDSPFAILRDRIQHFQEHGK